MEFEISEAGGGERVVTSIGHGWEIFLVDQKVQQDTLIVFEVADDTTLACTLYHPSSPRKPLPAGEDAPPRRHSNGPSFTKTLRSSHLKPGVAGRLVSFQTSPLWLFRTLPICTSLVIVYVNVFVVFR